MKLNDIACLNYEVGTDKAVVMLATTDLDVIKAIPEAAELMIYDGIGNPLFSLCGFDRIVSIRLFIEDNASEVVLAKTDSTLLDMKSRLNALEESAPAAQTAADLSSLVFVCLAQDAVIDDTTIMEHTELFPEWNEHWTGKSGSIVRLGEILYRAIHDVGAGQNTNPAETPAMWTCLGEAGAEFPTWSQPIGVHDAYAQGDKVTFEDKHYVSEIDGNVWQPGVYGWAEMEE